MWQKVCGVRFATGKFGWPSTITIYPSAQKMAGAMVTYTATRQIIYSTTQQFPSDDWTRMAFAHEIGHCFGWSHSSNNLPENLMFWKGSSLFYHAANEARRARQQFGQPSSKTLPYSIYWLKQKIAELKKLKQSTTVLEAQLKRVQAEWKAIGDPFFAALPKAKVEICECFSNSPVMVQSRNWEYEFKLLREKERAITVSSPMKFTKVPLLPLPPGNSDGN
jgi:hypothetical protein